MKDNSSVLFYFFTLYTFLGKNQSKCRFLRLLSAQIKIHQILVIFETKNQLWHWTVVQNLNKHWPSLFKSGTGWTFIRALKTLKNYTLMSSFCSKHMFQLEYFRGIMYHETEGWYKIYRKADLWLEKRDMRNLVNFHASSQKSENLLFDQILLSKAYKDLDEKVQKN